MCRAFLAVASRRSSQERGLRWAAPRGQPLVVKRVDVNAAFEPADPRRDQHPVGMPATAVWPNT